MNSTKEEKMLTWATTFTVTATGVLLLAGSILVFRMTKPLLSKIAVSCIHTMADANRIMSLAKTYDARAAAINAVEMVTEFGKAISK